MYVSLYRICCNTRYKISPDTFYVAEVSIGKRIPNRSISNFVQIRLIQSKNNPSDEDKDNVICHIKLNSFIGREHK
jgi:hypothetical protein